LYLAVLEAMALMMGLMTHSRKPKDDYPLRTLLTSLLLSLPTEKYL
jgi:hypothetical protein